jgi:hypothetical protein
MPFLFRERRFSGMRIRRIDLVHEAGSSFALASVQDG